MSKYSLLLYFLYLSFGSFANTKGWEPFEELYNDGQLKVEIQFKFYLNSCENLKSNKFRYHITGNPSKNQKIEWELNFIDCNGNDIVQPQSFLVKTGSQNGLIESIDYTFMGAYMDNGEKGSSDLSFEVQEYLRLRDLAKTRTYSIQKEDKWLFEKLKERQIKTIHDFFKSYSKIPTYYQFERQYDKYKRIQLLYSISYSISYANEIQMNIIAEKGLSDAHLFKKSIALQEISALKIEGFKVNSKLIFDKFYIDFVRGIMKVKIKNGKVEFLESIPPNYIQKKMMNTIKNMGNGTYALGYEYSKIMGEEDIFIIFYK